MNTPRRPTMPIGVFEAKSLPPQPSTSKTEVTTDREVQFSEIDTPLTSPEVALRIELTKRWRACDVYVQPPAALDGTTWFRAKVFAINRGVRPALVASGFWTNFSFAANSQVLTRIAAARGVCERWAVELTQLSTNIVIAGAKVGMTVVGSDEATDPDYGVGVFPASYGMLEAPLRVPQAGDVAAPSFTGTQVEIVRAVASNNHATDTRWLHFVERTTVALAGGVAPVFSVLIPAQTTIVVGPEVFAGYRFTAGCIGGGSSTRATFTASNDVQWKAWVR